MTSAELALGLCRTRVWGGVHDDREGEGKVRKWGTQSLKKMSDEFSVLQNVCSFGFENYLEGFSGCRTGWGVLSNTLT